MVRYRYPGPTRCAFPRHLAINTRQSFPADTSNGWRMQGRQAGGAGTGPTSGLFIKHRFLRKIGSGPGLGKGCRPVSNLGVNFHQGAQIGRCAPPRSSAEETGVPKIHRNAGRRVGQDSTMAMCDRGRKHRCLFLLVCLLFPQSSFSFWSLPCLSASLPACLPACLGKRRAACCLRQDGGLYRSLGSWRQGILRRRGDRVSGLRAGRWPSASS